MPYKYDVFISYPGGLARHWTQNHFAPKLRMFLPEAVLHDAAVFLDRTGIETGDHWPQRLQDALNESRCMIAVFCPSYFRSAWCVAELNTMLQRPGGKVIPIQLMDGEHFPSEVAGLQFADFRDFGRTTLTTEKAARFEDELVGLCQRLAEVIRSAPEWQADWPVLQPPVAGEVPVVRMPRVQ